MRCLLGFRYHSDFTAVRVPLQFGLQLFAGWNGSKSRARELRGLERVRLRKLSGWKRAYGVLLFCAATAIALPAQTFSTLVSFNASNGASPTAPLAQGLDGNLYGTTNSGGANRLGTVFHITPGGALSTLYSFCPHTGCPDGTNPFAGLVLGTTGNFYGTTANAGANRIGGTVFEITPASALTTLHSFCTQTSCTDGDIPYAGLVQAADTIFYGTTEYGGANGGGTVFKITPGGMLTTLYSFCAQTNCTDGQSPSAALVQGIDGDFYGTTLAGGAHSSDLCGPPGFAEPCGTVFKITSEGILTTVYSFCAQTNCSDGGLPLAPLVQATDGNFYGTTSRAGANGNGGTVFKITPAGTLTTLYSFCTQTNCADGDGPEAGLFQATNGTLYGTTLTGGANFEGTVFSLAVGLRSFVETLPTSAKVGATVKILGNNLKGTSSVTFNGTAATFTVISGTEIKTIVPSGATTGFVKVTTPTKTLKSNMVFRVTK